MNCSIDQLYSGVIHPFIVMNGVQFNCLKHIVDFMYQGEIKVLDSDLEGVLALGESLRVKGLCSVKLRQKIGLNEAKPIEQPPISPQPKRQPPQVVEAKNLVENARSYTRVPKPQSTLPSEEVINLSLSEPKNYSKVTLDALSENKLLPQNINNGIKEVKGEDKGGKESIFRGQPLVKKDLDEPRIKRIKGNPPPLIIRKSVSTPISSSVYLIVFN